MADIFETANCIVALGGDINNTVPKYGITAGEAAMLQVIHGNDALTDIEPSGTVKRSNRAEKARLGAIYGKARDTNGNLLIELVYPGAAARIFQRFDELELASAQYMPGMAPAGLDERRAADVDALEEGVLAADGEDAANGIDELPADDRDAEGALS